MGTGICLCPADGLAAESANLRARVGSECQCQEVSSSLLLVNIEDAIAIMSGPSALRALRDVMVTYLDAACASRTCWSVASRTIATEPRVVPVASFTMPKVKST